MSNSINNIEVKTTGIAAWSYECNHHGWLRQEDAEITRLTYGSGNRGLFKVIYHFHPANPCLSVESEVAQHIAKDPKHYSRIGQNSLAQQYKALKASGC